MGLFIFFSVCPIENSANTFIALFRNHYFLMNRINPLEKSAKEA